MKNSEINRQNDNDSIVELYQTYTSFYIDLLRKEKEITPLMVHNVKAKFKDFFSRMTLDNCKNNNNTKFRKLYLKYLPFYCLFQNIPDSTFSKTKNEKAVAKSIFLAFKTSNQQFLTLLQESGYKSVSEAFANVFEFDLEKTFLQFETFLNSTQNEYQDLLLKMISNIKRGFRLKSFRLGKDLLSKKEKLRIYRGKWLSVDYRKKNPNEISKRLLTFFQKHNFLSQNTVSLIDHHLEIANKNSFMYSDLTVPEIDWNTNSVKKYHVFNNIDIKQPFHYKKILHEIGHVITLSNLPHKADIYNYIPYESAVNELGGEMFEILLFFPEVISEVYKITDPEECEKIAEYNRFVDLISKRYLAILFLIYIKHLQNSDSVHINSPAIQEQVKESMQTHLLIQPTKTLFFSENLIHLFDYIRGYILIHEQFYQICREKKDRLRYFEKKMKYFIEHLFFNPFEDVQAYFISS